MISRVKWLVIKIHALFRYGILRYLKNKLRRTKLTLSLQRLPDEASDLAHEVKIIFKEKVNEGTKPIFSNLPKYIDSNIYDGKQLSPQVSYHRINNACVIGRTEFIIKDKIAYYPGIITPELDMFMTEIEGYASLSDDLDSMSISVIKCNKTIEKAISLFGQANGNYAHFLTETLSRLVVLDELDISLHVPLLIEDNLHPKFYEALNLLNVNDRKVIRVSPYEMVSVKELVYISPISYVAPETRSWFTNKTLAPPRRDQFVFSKEGLELLRTRSVEISSRFVPHITKREIGLKGKKYKNLDVPDFLLRSHEYTHLSDMELVFLKREAVTTGNGRLLKNQSYLMEILAAYNFISLDPAEFSFQEQVIAFRKARIVVSPVGASLSNLIFCESGVNIVLITPVFPGATFFYFANLFCCMGHNITYIFGKQSLEEGNGYQEFYNRDYTAPIQEILSAIDYYDAKQEK